MLAKGGEHQSSTSAYTSAALCPQVHLKASLEKKQRAQYSSTLSSTVNTRPSLQRVVRSQWVTHSSCRWHSFLASGSRFTCEELFVRSCLGMSCVASAPCQYPRVLALGHTLAHTHTHTHTHTRHQPAGRRQLCSLKGKENSCACDSWSSHDIPSPNIRDGFGRNGESAREGSIYNLDEKERPRLQPATRLKRRSSGFFLRTFTVIMWEVMSLSSVYSPYNSPPFAFKTSPMEQIR